jgi:hypothetical protein
MRRRVIPSIMVSAIFLCACSARSGDPFDIDLTEAASAQSVGTTAGTTADTEAGVSEPAPDKDWFKATEDDALQINVTKLLKLNPDDEAMYASPLDGRYAALLVYRGDGTQWLGCEISVIDLLDENVAYTQELNGFPVTVSNLWGFKSDADGMVRVYTYAENGAGEWEYFENIISPDGAQINGIDEEPFDRLSLGNLPLVQYKGGIFEERGGELVELLPQLPDDVWTDGTGGEEDFAAYWNMRINRLFYS